MCHPTADDSLDGFDAHPFVPAKRLDELPHVIEALDKLRAEHNRGSSRRAGEQRTDDLPGVSEVGRRLLLLWALRPYIPVSRIWPQIGDYSYIYQANIHKEIQDHHLAQFKDPRLGKRRLLLMALTTEGWRYLQLAPPEEKGRGGTEHRHYAHFLKWVGERRGYEAHIEWQVPGSDPAYACDGAWLVGGKWEAFEIAVDCIENIPDHLRATLPCPVVSSVTILSPQKRSFEKIQAIIDRDIALAVQRGRIRFQPLEPLVEELWPCEPRPSS